MHVFNPILSKNFIYSDLKLTDNALYYRNKVEEKYDALSDDIYITDNPQDICNLLGLDLDTVTSASLEEFFEMLLKSDKFRFSRFQKERLKVNNTVELFTKFADYIEENRDIINPEFNTLDFEFFSDINPKFMEAWEESNIWLKGRKSIGSKFNGRLIKQFYTDYDMTTLSTTIPMFKDSFQTKKYFELFVIQNNNETIMEAFKNRTKQL
jgi:hypothetical protein